MAHGLSGVHVNSAWNVSPAIEVHVRIAGPEGAVMIANGVRAKTPENVWVARSVTAASVAFRAAVMTVGGVTAETGMGPPTSGAMNVVGSSAAPTANGALARATSMMRVPGPVSASRTAFVFEPGFLPWPPRAGRVSVPSSAEREGGDRQRGTDSSPGTVQQEDKLPVDRFRSATAWLRNM